MLMLPVRRFRRIPTEVRLRREFESLSRRSINAYQLERLNRLWDFAVRTVPHYRELARRLALPGSFRTLEEFSARLPLLEKKEVQAQPERFLSERREPGLWKRTGGSTGVPLPCYMGRRARLENLWDRDALLASWGLDPRNRSAIIDGHRFDLVRSGAEARARFRQEARDRLRGRLRLSAYFLEEDRLRRFYDRMRAARVRLLQSYSTPAFLMARAAGGLPPIDSLSLVLTFAEPLPDHFRDAIEHGLHTRSGTEYSTIETGFIAGTHGDGRTRVAERGLIFETIPTPDGRREIVLTDLRNPSFPLIRYRLQDTLAAPPEIGPSGCAAIGPVEGRVLDVIRTRSGRLFLGASVIIILKEYPFVRLFRVVQDNLDEITIFIQADPGGGDQRYREPTARLEAAFGGELAVRIKPVDRMTLTPAGKHRLIESRLSAPENGDSTSPPLSPHLSPTSGKGPRTG